MIKSDIKICYLGIYRPTAPRDKVYLEGLKTRGVSVIECVDSSPGLYKFWRLFKKHRQFKSKYDILWVGYLSTMLVPLARIISRKKIVFNALSSGYESAVLDREMHSRFSLKAVTSWLFDFLAFHISDFVLVESESQKKFLAKSFFVRPSKFAVIFTGADPEVFFPDPTVAKRERFTVVFRGMFLPATGVEYVIEAARILRNELIDFIIIGWGPELPKVRSLLAEYKLPNVTLMAEFLEPKALRELILSCHIMLGQFSDHPRLERTIQHKTFEALALGMPYITRDSASNRELLIDGKNCVFVPAAKPQAIANSIIDLKRKEDFRRNIGMEARLTYSQKLTPKILAEQLALVVFENKA